MTRTPLALFWLLLGLSLTAPSSASTIAEQENRLRQLDERVQELKRASVDLKTQLRNLEEELLYPDEQEVAFYVSLAITSFDLQRLELLVDGRELAVHNYNARELYALRRGGLHRFFVGNLAPGARRLTAVFYGQFIGDPPEAPRYRREIDVTFEKTSRAKDLELKIGRNRRRDLVLNVVERERRP